MDLTRWKLLQECAGIGLRNAHYQTVLNNRPLVNWFEVHTENFMIEGGPALQKLDKFASLYPLSLHGVGMSLGSVQPLSRIYLKKLKELINRVNPIWVSDHLCWCINENKYIPDLLPMPYTNDSIQHLVERIDQVQNFLGQKILVENLSSYLSFQYDVMPEWEFVAQIASKADCYLLLDINNIYVSAKNHNFDPNLYIEHMPADCIKEYHLAGYSDKGEYLLDTHNNPVSLPVWELYKKAIASIGPRPTLIEWDSELPDFKVLQAEANMANKLMAEQKTFNHEVA